MCRGLKTKDCVHQTFALSSGEARLLPNRARVDVEKQFWGREWRGTLLCRPGVAQSLRNGARTMALLKKQQTSRNEKDREKLERQCTACCYMKHHTKRQGSNPRQHPDVASGRRSLSRSTQTLNMLEKRPPSAKISYCYHQSTYSVDICKEASTVGECSAVCKSHCADPFWRSAVGLAVRSAVRYTIERLLIGFSFKITEN